MSSESDHVEPYVIMTGQCVKCISLCFSKDIEKIAITIVGIHETLFCGTDCEMLL